MALNLPKRNLVSKIQTMQNVLNDKKEEETKAKAQEEVMLKQLQELFECNSIEEGQELLDQLMEEKEEIDSDLEAMTDDLWMKMKADGLI